MKLIVLDERQEHIIHEYLTLLSCKDMEASTKALVQDIFEQLECNEVSAEDVEKILDAGINIKV